MNMLDDWQRVKAAFEQALAVCETERSAFLAAACGSDALLRQHVEALLASHAASQSFLEAGASSVLAQLCGEDLSGQRLGTYRLQSRIGALALAKERYVCRVNVAAADVGLGDTEQAFESLEEAYLQRST
jgi:hypothetical protein